MSLPSSLGSLPTTAKRFMFRAVRGALFRYVRAQPRPSDHAGAERRVTIILVSAWGMGGTIRTVLNLAGHLAEHYEVEIISVFRRREVSFFGSFPPGVKVTALDDQRPEALPRGLRGRLRTFMRGQSSVLMHPIDRAADQFNLWIDVQLARRLHRGTGYLITTRPGLNLLAAELSPPGYIKVGQEHMHLSNHARKLRQAMPRQYPKLDALAVLTDQDRVAYEALLNGSPPVTHIPNTVRPMGGPKADPSAKTILAAGRVTPQKGFDMLIKAFAQVAPDHPDWTLRILGRGDWLADLERLVAEHGIGDAVVFDGPSEDLGGEMSRASIYALSSRFEGFPLVLIEAMSKGMAVVAFDCPTGPADVIDDHRNGLLVPPKDVDAYAAALREMMDDEELRRRCGEAAVESAKAYEMERIGPSWDALLEQLGARLATPV
jgi:glycosyltransferase involved in cell wall biosynthesis